MTKIEQIIEDIKKHESYKPGELRYIQDRFEGNELRYQLLNYSLKLMDLDINMMERRRFRGKK